MKNLRLYFWCLLLPFAGFSQEASSNPLSQQRSQYIGINVLPIMWTNSEPGLNLNVRYAYHVRDKLAVGLHVNGAYHSIYRHIAAGQLVRYTITTTKLAPFAEAFYLYGGGSQDENIDNSWLSYSHQGHYVLASGGLNYSLKRISFDGFAGYGFRSTQYSDHPENGSYTDQDGSFRWGFRVNFHF